MSLFFLLGSMHQLHKSERGVGGSQGPTSHPDPHAHTTTTGLPPCDTNRVLVSHPEQPSSQITTIRPATTRAAARSHTPGATMSPAVAPPTQPSTLNHTDKPLPSPNAPALISQTYRSVDQFLQFEGRGPCCHRYSCYKPKTSSILSPSPPVLLLFYGKECQDNFKTLSLNNDKLWREKNLGWKGNLL